MLFRNRNNHLQRPIVITQRISYFITLRRTLTRTHEIIDLRLAGIEHLLYLLTCHVTEHDVITTLFFYQTFAVGQRHTRTNAQIAGRRDRRFRLSTTRLLVAHSCLYAVLYVHRDLTHQIPNGVLIRSLQTLTRSLTPYKLRIVLDRIHLLRKKNKRQTEQTAHQQK